LIQIKKIEREMKKAARDLEKQIEEQPGGVALKV
jgi:hypothetical protein